MRYILSPSTCTPILNDVGKCPRPRVPQFHVLPSGLLDPILLVFNTSSSKLQYSTFRLWPSVISYLWNRRSRLAAYHRKSPFLDLHFRGTVDLVPALLNARSILSSNRRSFRGRSYTSSLGPVRTFTDQGSFPTIGDLRPRGESAFNCGSTAEYASITCLS